MEAAHNVPIIRKEPKCALKSTFAPIWADAGCTDIFPGGFDYYQVFDLIKGATERGRVAAIDFVEYMPEVDVDDLGALVVSRLIASAMGMLARQQQGHNRE